VPVEIPSGIDDQDVKTAKPFDGLLVGYISRNGQGTTTIVFNPKYRIINFYPAARCTDDGCTSLGIGDGDCSADPATCSGDNGHLAG
jgi:hypothetical protein